MCTDVQWFLTVQGLPCSWPREDLLLTTITRSSCKQCGFFEDRLIPFIRVRIESKSSHLKQPFLRFVPVLYISCIRTSFF